MLADNLLKIKKRIKKFKRRVDSRYIYQNKTDKSCFQHDMASEDFNDLLRRTGSDKVLHDKAFNIAKNPEYGRRQRGITSMNYKYFN